MSVDVVQMAFLGDNEDDRTFARHKRITSETKRHQRKVEQAPPPLPKGPCCGRCRAYQDSTDGKGFGQCQYLGITTMSSRGIERGSVVDWKMAETGAGIDSWEPLNIKPWFEGCSAFVSREGERAA